MSEIKIYRIIGNYKKDFKKYLFRKEVRALKEEDALEKVLSQITSIGIFRRQINIQEIKEITLEEAQDYLIRELSE
ncbi:MAG: 50S ribosomal protein L18a [Candidatus Lokiarchaeota archaeon]|jgi:ribosomal protein L20A (L18A)|nr:50S ribosomal protein L18a [Candidatus Lokiarchaeota archaeon]MCK4381797.1 50S ribosomal protein L18a [Candidatus Lokiarchaeota archaeon]